MLITPFLSFFFTRANFFFGDKLRITMRIKPKTGIIITVDLDLGTTPEMLKTLM